LSHICSLAGMNAHEFLSMKVRFGVESCVVGVVDDELSRYEVETCRQPLNAVRPYTQTEQQQK